MGAKARMAAFRQNVESAEDRPISESEVMSADRSANEKIPLNRRLKGIMMR